ncbi:chromosome partitioning protein [Larkinella arboricola]|uniref:Chromosome partitioning protein n=1 Tax=Larkinella arboricola TaxID=643671 RepID=A0A327WHN0_LARAB|nr:ParA family protein [Larkinella arboricola]RAJ89177.1 chromosome partitioning protein [Larkinella arboricola]
MKVIAVVNQKGGVGKSTISFNLAHCFASELRVGIVDVDAQGTIRNMDDALGAIELLPIEQLSTLRSKPFDVVVIDTPPYFSDRLEDVLSVSDFVLIPVKPSYVDVMALKPTVGIVRRQQEVQPELKAGIVINMAKPRTSINQDIDFLLRDIGLPKMEVTLSERVAFIRSFVTNGVFEGDDLRAINEITNLAEELLGRLGI